MSTSPASTRIIFPPQMPTPHPTHTLAGQSAKHRSAGTSKHEQHAAIICERRLRWHGHVRRMDKGRSPKDLLYGELVEGTRPARRPRLRFKDVCKRDMKTCHIDINTWEACAEDRATWRLLVKQGTKES